MTTQQHDTAALMDEQVEGVAGGILGQAMGLNSGFRSSTHIGNPAPKPPNLKKGLASSPLGLQGNYVGVLNPDSM